MRASLLKFGGMVILAICLGGHITELFDRWESASLSGNDIDYTCVVAAAVAGAVLVLSGTLQKCLPTRSQTEAAPLPDSESVSLLGTDTLTPAHSPPFALRI